jgi:hypothetical protein
MFASCTPEDADYFWNGPPNGSYSPAYSSSNDNNQWQQTKRQAEFQQQSQSYKSGYSNTPPPGYSPY